VMDGDDFIVAEDFLLELPEFEHRPEWFVPFAPDPARSRHG
jgi:hypothetical protein